MELYTDLSGVAVKTAEEAQQELDFLQNKLDCCLVIDGDSLQVSRNINLLE
jgi:phospholipid-translocating ATPase